MAHQCMGQILECHSAALRLSGALAEIGAPVLRIQIIAAIDVLHASLGRDGVLPGPGVGVVDGLVYSGHALAVGRLVLQGDDLILDHPVELAAVVYGHKGDLIEVSARFTERKWEDKEGRKRVSVEFVADDCKILSGRRREEDGQDWARDGGADGCAELEPLSEDDGELPF